MEHFDKRYLFASVFVLVLIALGWLYLLLSPKSDLPIETVKTDPFNLEYKIGNESFQLVKGVAVKDYPGEAGIENRLSVFGAPVYGDLDSDGDLDVAVLLEHSPGGSGTFYYGVLVISEGSTYRATETMFLGDRIAPQTIEIRDGRAVYNIMERRADEPMSVKPSFARSIWVHYDARANQIGEWVKDFEGEVDTKIMNEINIMDNKREVSSGTMRKKALLANGCFWCVESDLVKVAGVIDVVSGYAGGQTENPTYENYSKGGHREVVEVTYDDSLVSFANLVEHIIKHGDPTDAEGSFGDRGEEYTPAIYYSNTDEKAEAERVIKAIDALKSSLARY